MPISPVISKMTSPSLKKKPAKNTISSPGPGGLEDFICPICDDLCTCSGAQVASGITSGWSSPIIIKDKIKKATGISIKKPAPKRSVQKTKKDVSRKSVKIDQKADKMAQYVLSEYYFSMPDDEEALFDHFESYSDNDDDDDQGTAEGNVEENSDYDFESDSSCLDEILFELSDSEDEETAKKIKNLLMSKVKNVLGPNANAWIESDSGSSASCSSETDEEPGALYFFDPTDASNLIVNLPVPEPASLPASQGTESLSNITPQVLAAISAAAKTLTAATQHYSNIPTVPYSRDSGKQVTFVIEPSQESESTPIQMNLEDVIDTSRLHGSSPPVSPSPSSQFLTKRWDKIPISSFRKRRGSVPRNVLPQNAIKQPPPEVPQESFAQLHITDDFSDELFMIVSGNNSNFNENRSRRATVALAVDDFEHWRQEKATSNGSDGDADYLPMGADEEFYWLGEHFRTHAV